MPGTLMPSAQVSLRSPTRHRKVELSR
jgi:hypothetical protein